MIIHTRAPEPSAGPPGLIMAPRCRETARVVAAAPWVRHVEASVPLDLLLDVATSDSALMAADTVVAFLGVAADGAQAAGWSGQECLLAVIDNGFELVHPDFVDSSGASRVVLLWDQTASDTPPPAGFDYGSLWTGEEITAGTCTQTAGAHGTRVLGAAAGNGRGMADLRYRGVAAESALLLVKTDGLTDRISDALAWIALTATALQKPVSVNLSLGSHYGAHDGTRADELAIDAVSGEGVIVTCAAGNSDGVPVHAKGAVPAAGETDSLALAVGDYPQSGAIEGFGLDLWYPGACSLRVVLRDPFEALHGPVAMGDTLAEDAVSGNVWIANDVDAPLNGDHHAVLIVSDDGAADSVSAGAWTVTLQGDGRGEWHAWLFMRSHGATSIIDADSTCTLVMPGTADSCLTVGGYSRDNGNAYDFSSRGPTRDGRDRPDLCAPTFITTPNPGGAYALFSGTSASSPQVAGAVALALSRSADVGPADMRASLRTSARTDGLVTEHGLPPTDKWGHGRLYVEPLVRSFGLIAISVAGDTTFALTWGDAAGADAYEVYRDTTAFFAPDSGGFSNRVAVVSLADDEDPAEGFQWEDPSADPLVAAGRLCAYVVRALKGDESWWSDTRAGGLTRDTHNDRRMR
jgi:hypothetical protein